jgi:hypothetical protein
VIDPFSEVTVHKLLFPILGWFAIVLVAFVTRATFMAAPVGVTETLLWFFAAGAPAGVVMMLSRNSPSGSVAQVIYDAEQSRSDRRS